MRNQHPSDDIGTILTVRIVSQQLTAENHTYYEIEIATEPAFLGGLYSIDVKSIKWRLWHRYSEVKSLYDNLSQKVKGLPAFQSALKASLQGASPARLNFLQKFLNELVKPKHLSKLLNISAFTFFFGLQAQVEAKQWLESQLAHYEQQSPTISTHLNRRSSFEVIKTEPKSPIKPQLITLDNNGRIDQYLKQLQELHDEPNGDRARQFFDEPFLNAPFSEDQVRRIFNGNGINQSGLFQFAQRPEYKREIVKLLSETFDVTRNKNFEVYEKVFGRTLPAQLQKCDFGSLLNNSQSCKDVVKIISVYTETKQKNVFQILEIIFPEESQRAYFSECMGLNKHKIKLRSSETTKSSLLVNTKQSRSYIDIVVTPNSPGKISQKGTFQKQTSCKSIFFATDQRVLTPNSKTPVSRRESSSFSESDSSDNEQMIRHNLFGRVKSNPILALLKQSSLPTNNSKNSSSRSRSNTDGNTDEIEEQKAIIEADSSNSDNDDALTPKSQNHLFQMVNAIVSSLHKSHLAKKHELHELYMNSQVFKSEGLYLFRFKAIGTLESEEYNIVALRAYLEAMLQGQSGTKLSMQLQKAGICMSFVREIGSCIKLVEIRCSQQPSKQYLLAYSVIENRGYISILAFSGSDGSLGEKLVFSLSQEICSKQLPLNTVQENPYEEEADSLRFMSILDQKKDAYDSTEGSVWTKEICSTQSQSLKSSQISLKGSQGDASWQGRQTTGTLQLLIKVPRQQPKKVRGLINTLCQLFELY